MISFVDFLFFFIDLQLSFLLVSIVCRLYKGNGLICKLFNHKIVKYAIFFSASLVNSSVYWYLSPTPLYLRFHCNCDEQCFSRYGFLKQCQSFSVWFCVSCKLTSFSLQQRHVGKYASCYFAIYSQILVCTKERIALHFLVFISFLMRFQTIWDSVFNTEL